MDQPPSIETGRAPIAGSALPSTLPAVGTPPAPVPQSPAQQPPPAEVKPEIKAVVVEPPKPLRQVRPVLPPNVRAMLTERITIQIRVQVDSSGKVTHAEPLSTAGRLGGFLGTAAVNAARLWTFEPATRGNEKVAGEFMLHFTFLPGADRP